MYHGPEEGTPLLLRGRTQGEPGQDLGFADWPSDLLLDLTRQFMERAG